MSPDDVGAHVSSFDLDLLELGALDAAKAAATNEHLERCAPCREEHEKLRRARGEFTANVLLNSGPRLLAEVRHRNVPRISPPRIVAAGLLASAAVLALVLRPRATPTEVVSNPGGDHLTAKGGSELSLVARQDGSVFNVDSAHRSLRAGAEVRLVLSQDDPARPFVLVASVDGRGHPSVYYPPQGEASARIERPGKWELPGSIVLDDAPGPERIFAFFSATPIESAVPTQALRRLGEQGWEAMRATSQVDLDGVRQSSVLIEKVAAP